MARKVLDPLDSSQINRKMRAHKKSRQGCGNCKLRKVKCDETKPMCRKCKTFGTFCNYDSRYSDLQPLVADAPMLYIPPCSENELMLGNVNYKARTSSIHLEEPTYQFTTHDLEIVYKFRTRTMYSLGAIRCGPVYQNAYASLTLAHPFLFHTVLTLTLMHDQYLNLETKPKLNTAIALHWSRGAALLNQKLSHGIEEAERDALWACAGILGALSFTSTETDTQQLAWPLKNPGPSDLTWLRMSKGKKVIWNISDPLRSDSIFCSLRAELLKYTYPPSTSLDDLDTLPPSIIRVCAFPADVTVDENPYLGCASFLARTVDLPCTDENTGLLLSFFGAMHPDFTNLAAQKDPCALLLLAVWYAKICQCRQWWIWRRACLEGQAICRFLKAYHGDDANVLEAVSGPEKVFKVQMLECR